MDRNNSSESFSPGYCDYLVPGNVNTQIILIRIAVIIAGIALGFGLFALLSFIPQVFVIWLVVILFLIVMVFRLTKSEFEYTIVMGEMTVEAIYGKRFRRKLASFKLSDADRIFPVSGANDKQIEHLRPSKLIYAAPKKSEHLYCLYIKDNVSKNAKTAIVFSSCTKLISAMKFYNRAALTERK